MKPTLALFRFELERRWLAPAVSLFFGLVVFVLPYLPGGPSRVPANELRAVAASVAGVTLAALFAIILGTSLFANDLAERRASFLFARPIGSTAIAVSRFLAALVLVVASTLLIMLPALLAGMRAEAAILGFGMLEGLSLLALLAAASAALLLLTSAVTLTARARTAWVGLELTALVVTGFLVERADSVLRDLFLQSAENRLLAGIACALLVSFAAIFLAAIVHGRADLARAHGAQAKVGAALLVAIGVAAVVWAGDYIAPSFDEVLEGTHSAYTVAPGKYVIVGSERGRDEFATSYLLDGATGRSQRAGQILGGEPSGSASVQAGGGDCFWPRRDGGQVRIERGAFAATGIEVELTSLEFDRLPSSWAVSSDGARFAVLRSLGSGDGSLLEVHEISSGRLLQSTRLPAFMSWNSRLASEGDGFRLVAWGREIDWSSWRIERDGSATRTARLAAELDPLFWILDGERRRVLLRVRSETERGWLVLDAASLERVALLTPTLLRDAESSLGLALALFPDGSIGTTARRTDRRELALFSPGGELLHSSIWPTSGVTRFAGSGAEHTLLLASRAEDGRSDRAEGWTVDRYDLVSGERRTVARDLLPMASPPLGRPGTLLLRDASGAFQALDPDTGTLTRLPAVR